MERQAVIGRVAAVGAVFLMSFGPSIVKLADVAEITFIFWRLLVAVVFYSLLLAATGRRLPWEDFRRCIPGGVLFGVNLVFFILTMRRTSAANAVVIASLQPVVLIGIAGPLFGERPRPSIYLWSAMAMGGVVVAMTGADATGVATRTGDLLAVGTMLLFAAYYVVSKRSRVNLDSATYQVGLTVVATLTVLPFAPVMGQSLAPPPVDQWTWIALMAVIPGTGHLLTNYALGHVPIILMSLVGLLFTAVAPLYAWWLVGETIGGVQALGMALVIAALAVVVTRPVEKPPALTVG